ncbi:hypothetical protein GLAREA_09290 [Glarea lozoyensis ATCC 20868]|uniref:Uncharacterized protein n=1 Tax=Glarea lozoyensis (strain ATCC 20868 / MF5171) TaxID=1116229 RepID=S3DFC7_GLAL2|nr:uncharacterized protein GLAREA_09290 [Glarea lozoyensis ATCC 20868]EPE37127.1 hypothetical protein GLAREA_09290 [Glarea lozoyensis ATCC 20868]
MDRNNHNSSKKGSREPLQNHPATGGQELNARTLQDSGLSSRQALLDPSFQPPPNYLMVAGRNGSSSQTSPWERSRNSQGSSNYPNELTGKRSGVDNFSLRDDYETSQNLRDNHQSRISSSSYVARASVEPQNNGQSQSSSGPPPPNATTYQPSQRKRSVFSPEPDDFAGVSGHQRFWDSHKRVRQNNLTGTESGDSSLSWLDPLLRNDSTPPGHGDRHQTRNETGGGSLSQPTQSVPPFPEGEPCDRFSQRPKPKAPHREHPYHHGPPRNPKSEVIAPRRPSNHLPQPLPTEAHYDDLEAAEQRLRSRQPFTIEYHRLGEHGKQKRDGWFEKDYDDDEHGATGQYLIDEYNKDSGTERDAKWRREHADRELNRRLGQTQDAFGHRKEKSLSYGRLRTPTERSQDSRGAKQYAQHNLNKELRDRCRQAGLWDYESEIKDPWHKKGSDEGKHE